MAAENYRTVYEQYWLHARHVETEIWQFTMVYSGIITAIFVVIGARLPLEVKIGTSIFGIILSVLGLLLVYTLRIPFINFACMSELLMINHFQIPNMNNYRRFLRLGQTTFLGDKRVELHDILSAFYSLIAGIMLFMLILMPFAKPKTTIPLEITIASFLISIGLIFGLFIIHWCVFRRIYHQTWGPYQALAGNPVGNYRPFSDNALLGFVLTAIGLAFTFLSIAWLGLVKLF